MKFTLNLDKKHKGYYTKRVGLTQIIVSKYSKGWEAVIQKYSYTAKDVFGTEVDIYENMTDTFYAPTKKEVSSDLAHWIYKNDLING